LIPAPARDGSKGELNSNRFRSELVKLQNELKQEDPWLVLGVSQEADDNEIRTAYMRKIKEYPPDRCGPEFERIRDAYDQLKDPYRRAEYLILGASLEMPLESLLDDIPATRRYVGPELWLEAMKSLCKERREDE
jgi:hypothetical protein